MPDRETDERDERLELAEGEPPADLAAPGPGSHAPARLPFGVRMRATLANSATYLAGDALVHGIGVVLTPVYTRAMSPSDYGIVAVGMTLIALLTILLGLSLYGAITRLYFEAEDEEDRRTLYGTVLVFLIVVPALLALGFEALGRAGALEISDDVPYDPYVRLAVWTAYLSIFIEIPLAVYATREEPRKVIALTLSNAGLITLGTLYLVVARDKGAQGALTATLIAAGVMACVSIGLTIRFGSLRVSRRWLGAALRFSLPVVPHSLAQWGLFLSDRFILARFVSGSQLGLFSLGAMVGTVASFGVNAFNRAFTPVVTDELKRDGQTSDRVPRLGTYWLGGLLVICLLLAVFGDDAIRLATPEQYHGATVVVPWVVFGYFAMGAYTILAQGTWFSMRTAWIAPITVVAAGANILANFILVPEYGIEAAAWTTFGGFVLLALLHGILAAHLYRIPWEYGRWARLVVAGAATFFLADWPTAGETTAGALGIQIVVLCAALPIGLTLIGFWSASERDWLRARLAAARTTR
jgi:O-antigen/teichoic acid export membrane protein